MRWRDAAMRIVEKYGGSSLADRTRLLAAANHVASLARQGQEMVVVVSAMGDTTDHLLASIRGLPENPREQDMCLATGEQLSAGMMAMALEKMGVPAVSLTGAQAGILTDCNYGNAQILTIDPRRLERELAAGRVPVVAGFQGMDAGGNITTLGRGGSDTTAVALAAWLGAEECRIFTDVDGVYDRDPRKYPDAVRFSRIGYGEMLKLIENGAQVLHDRSVLLAQEKGISMEVRSAFTHAPGTVVG